MLAAIRQGHAGEAVLGVPGVGGEAADGGLGVVGGIVSAADLRDGLTRAVSGVVVGEAGAAQDAAIRVIEMFPGGELVRRVVGVVPVTRLSPAIDALTRAVVGVVVGVGGIWPSS